MTGHIAHKSTYLGCYHEQLHAPDLSGQAPLTVSNIESCTAQCATGRWDFAAIRNGTICTCGDQIMRYGAAPLASCSSECSEGAHQCGGPESNSIYHVEALFVETPAPFLIKDEEMSAGKEDWTSTHFHPSATHLSSSSQTIDSSPQNGHMNHRTVAISGTAVGIGTIVVGVILFMMYRNKRKQRVSNATGNYNTKIRDDDGSSFRGAMYNESFDHRDGRGHDGYDHHHHYQEQRSRVIQDRNPIEDDKKREHQTSIIESQLFDGFDSLIPLLPPKTLSTSYSSRVSLTSVYPVVEQQQLTPMMMTLFPAKSRTKFMQHTNSKTTVMAPTYPSLMPQSSNVSPISPLQYPAAANTTTPAAPAATTTTIATTTTTDTEMTTMIHAATLTPSQSPSLSPLQLYASHPILQRSSSSLKLSSWTSSIQQQRFQMIKEIILRDDDPIP